MLTPTKNIRQRALQFIATLWLCLEIGQFIETRLTVQNPLYWPLWIALTIIFVMGLILVDVLSNKH